MSAKCGKFNRHPGSISAPAIHRQSEICPQSVLHRATSATLSCPRPSRRLLRHCARPAFALERWREIDAEHSVYESIKPGPGGSISLMLTPLELIERLAALIPPPRRHRHRYYGVLAPNAPLRAQVTALVGVPESPTTPLVTATETETEPIAAQITAPGASSNSKKEACLLYTSPSPRD